MKEARLPLGGGPVPHGPAIGVSARAEADPRLDLRALLAIDTMQAPGNKGRHLDDEIFGVQPNVPVMHQVVTAQLAARRAGTQHASAATARNTALMEPKVSGSLVLPAKMIFQFLPPSRVRCTRPSSLPAQSSGGVTLAVTQSAISEAGSV